MGLKKKILIGIVCCLILYMCMFIYSIGGSFKPRYEITDKVLDSIEIKDFVGNYEMSISKNEKMSKADLGFKCGENVYKLGTLMSLKHFNVLSEKETEYIRIQHLLSPSRQYEIIAYQSLTAEDTSQWYIWGLRSMSPNVYTTRGIRIGDTKSYIQNKVGLKLKQEEYNVEGATICFNFNSGVLTEVFMHV